MFVDMCNDDGGVCVCVLCQRVSMCWCIMFVYMCVHVLVGCIIIYSTSAFPFFFWPCSEMTI